jgi:cytochrome c-type biogenesis protein CcmH
MIRVLMLSLALLLAGPALGPAMAVQPDEILSDPVLEARARVLSENIRCLVCRNENIDASNAELARDLRILVRERLVEGDSDQEVLDFLVDRYGEFVLMTPQRNGSNLVLWYAAPALFLLALVVAVGYLRSRQNATEVKVAGLSDEEEARLKDLLKD